MQIFLTGATGSIGSAVLRQTLAAGHRVTALARTESTASQLARNGALPVLGDIAQPESWINDAATADAFIHLANTFDDTMQRIEPRLLAALFAQTAKRQTPLRFLYTGGCWLFGATRGLHPATEDSPLNPISAFAWAAEAIESLKNRPGLNTAILHPAMVYDTTGGVFSRMLTALRRGRPAPIWGEESITWPLVHRDDAAAAYLTLLDNPDATGPHIVVAQPRVKLGQIAATLHAQAGLKTRPAVLPRRVALAQHGAWAEGPMLSQALVSTRMPALGWRPKHTDFSRLTYDIGQRA